jgi:hypothetical protein
MVTNVSKEGMVLNSNLKVGVIHSVETLITAYKPAGSSGRAVCGAGLDRLDADTVVSNPA